MLKLRFMQSLAAIGALAAMLCQGTWVLAGTTGTLSGVVQTADANGIVVGSLGGATVTATSASQNATTTTDASGNYSFVALAPDTYVLTVSKEGYDASSLPGINVFADQVATVNLQVHKHLATIAHIGVRAASSLVRPGTTTDVYSINPATQEKISAAGGGGTLNSAWSALATVPGVFVTPNQSGYVGATQSISIRGGDYNQIGYEVDGVPVNRSFDNYPSGSVSSLGQQELQVYTGVPPANAQSSGLSGYINQVIRTGTSPGFADIDLAVGGPSYYHKASFEIGGATPDRNFSYYLGIGGYNQEFRLADQFDGAGISQLFGTPIAPCTTALSATQFPSCFGPGGSPYATVGNSTPGSIFNPSPVTGACTPASGLVGCSLNGGTGTGYGAYVLGPAPVFGAAFNSSSGVTSVADRDNVVNLHFGLPHKNGTKDDIQLLGMIAHTQTTAFDSPSDQGGYALLAASGSPQFALVPSVTTPIFVDGYQYNSPTGVPLQTNPGSLIAPYQFPNVPAHAFDGTIPAGFRDGFENDQAIYKLQYTHNMGTSALFKLYGYTYYSDWLNTSPASLLADYVGDFPIDYELSSHTRGFSGSLIDQINPQNLINLTASWTNSSTLRDNNTEMINGVYPLVEQFLTGVGALPPGAYPGSAVNPRTALAVLVNANNPTSGVCYTSTGAPTTCAFAPGAGFGTPAQYATLDDAVVPGNGVGGTSIPAITASSCGGGPCEYFVVGNGRYATYNTVRPTFESLALTDEWHPGSKVSVNAGIRFDSFSFLDSDTSGTAARRLYYNAFNQDTCTNAAGQVLDKVINLGGSISQSCASLSTPATGALTPLTVSNPSGPQTTTFTEFQPRLGATFTLDPRTVLRASYGRYAQPPNTAFEQYDALQADAPALLYGTYNFNRFGFTTPDHAIRPEVSNNFDFSFEHQFPNQVSVKLTPFWRTTQDQIQQFYLNQATSFVSGLNVGKQTSRGVEFELDRGNFAAQGMSARLTFAYTNSYINYATLSNGSTVVSGINQAIQQYNGYTKACATGATASTNCATPASGTAAPCYTAGTINVTPNTPTTGAFTGGVPDPSCAAGDVANPYWNAAPQALINPNSNFPTFDILTLGPGSAVEAYGAPFTASLVVNDRVGRWSIAPIVQMFGGQRYGAPESTLGVAPDNCGTPLGTSTSGDPRYPYGASGRSPFDVTTCSSTLWIPNAFTGAFDGIGAFVEPTELQMHAQIGYEASNNVTFVANVTNLVNTCFGGTRVGWSVPGACTYIVQAGGVTPGGATGSGGIGNLYNPGQAIQPYVRTPYVPTWANLPFNVYVTAKIKL